MMKEGCYLEEANMLKDQYKEIEFELSRLRDENTLLKKSMEEQIGMSIQDIDDQTLQMREMRRLIKSYKEDLIVYEALCSSISEELDEENIDSANILISSLITKITQNKAFLKFRMKSNFSSNVCCHNSNQPHTLAKDYRLKIKNYKEESERKLKEKQAEIARRRQEIADNI